MFAVIQTGGKQYRVTEGQVLRIEKMEGETGQEILLDKVLLVGKGEDVRVGSPFLDDVKIRAEILGQRRSKKVIVFKYKRRKKYRNKQGHRQHYTGIRIKGIDAGAAYTQSDEASHGA